MSDAWNDRLAGVLVAMVLAACAVNIVLVVLNCRLATSVAEQCIQDGGRPIVMWQSVRCSR